MTASRFAKLFGLLAVAGLLSAPLVGDGQATPAQGDKKDDKVKQDKKDGKKKPKRPNPVWTDPNDPKLPASFKFQGEYVGTLGTAKIGCQVIALDDDFFQAVLLPGGLPGDGWDGKHKILMDGKLEGDRAIFTPTTGKRKYMADPPLEFAAVNKFPPAGQKDATAEASGGKMTGKIDGMGFELSKVSRTSQTIGAKPPQGAVILFDGTNTDEWSRGRLDKANGILNTDGGDIVSKRKFNNYVIHVEFMLPYRPWARSQGRGNSGFYQVDLYEIQVLDSFGLEGLNNECGGLYTKAKPKVNMCYPPLTWQTYDVEFTNAIPDRNAPQPGKEEGKDGDKKAGKKGKQGFPKPLKPAVVTVKHNGVVIHDNQVITGPTGGGRQAAEGTPGPLRLQGHGNPLQYRNIWIVEKKE